MDSILTDNIGRDEVKQIRELTSNLKRAKGRSNKHTAPFFGFIQ